MLSFLNITLVKRQDCFETVYRSVGPVVVTKKNFLEVLLCVNICPHIHP